MSNIVNKTFCLVLCVQIYVGESGCGSYLGHQIGRGMDQENETWFTPISVEELNSIENGNEIWLTQSDLRLIF